MGAPDQVIFSALTLPCELLSDKKKARNDGLLGGFSR